MYRTSNTLTDIACFFPAFKRRGTFTSDSLMSLSHNRGHNTYLPRFLRLRWHRAQHHERGGSERSSLPNLPAFRVISIDVHVLTLCVILTSLGRKRWWDRGSWRNVAICDVVTQDCAWHHFGGLVPRYGESGASKDWRLPEFVRLHVNPPFPVCECFLISSYQGYCNIIVPRIWLR